MTHTHQFQSISEFCTYINTTPTNEAFKSRCTDLKSSTGSQRFTQTNNFNEALSLLRNGWNEMAEELTQKLNTCTQQMPTCKYKSVLNIAGGHPIVPLYLTGVPNNMVDKQLKTVKSKVLNVVKLIQYSGFVTTEQIVEQSIKALQIVKVLESQGYRVNLYIGHGVEDGGTELITKIKIKGAGEKLNVSKVAFPLVHPSMLRRLIFRHTEVCPYTTYPFTHGYGLPMRTERMKSIFPNDIMLPPMFDSKIDITQIKDVDQIREFKGF